MRRRRAPGDPMLLAGIYRATLALLKPQWEGARGGPALPASHAGATECRAVGGRDARAPGRGMPWPPCGGCTRQAPATRSSCAPFSSPAAPMRHVADTRADAGECAGDLQRAAACAAALPAGPGECAASAAALRALAFLRRHIVPDAAAAARLAARPHAHGRACSPGARACGGGAGDAAAPAAVAAALEAAPQLMAAAAAAEARAGAAAESGAAAADRHAYGVASALVAAAQVRAAAALAGLERGGDAAAPVCAASAFECLWPAIDESLADGCAAAARACSIHGSCDMQCIGPL